MTRITGSQIKPNTITEAHLHADLSNLLNSIGQPIRDPNSVQVNYIADYSFAGDIEDHISGLIPFEDSHAANLISAEYHPELGQPGTRILFAGQRSGYDLPQIVVATRNETNSWHIQRPILPDESGSRFWAYATNGTYPCAVAIHATGTIVWGSSPDVVMHKIIGGIDGSARQLHQNFYDLSNRPRLYQENEPLRDTDGTYLLTGFLVSTLSVYLNGLRLPPSAYTRYDFPDGTGIRLTIPDALPDDQVTVDFVGTMNAIAY